LRKVYQLKKDNNFPFVEGDVLWNTKNTILYPALSTIAGITAGFLGVGGGMVAGPLMLELGILPQVVAVTSSYFILFTSSSTTSQFIFIGRLQWRFALWYGAVGFCGAILGQLFLAWLLKKYKKQWVVAAFIALTILVSTFALLFLNVDELFNGKEPISLKFNPLCGS